MRRVHPLWRGFFLACMLTAALLLTGGSDWLAALRGNIAAMTLAAMTAVGAGLCALPGLFRKRSKSTRRNPGWRRLVICFLSGMAMSLACGMAGTGRILPALAEGSSGAFAFLASAALTGFVTGRLVAGRAAA